MYTAEELIWATQLAYCNFEDEDIVKYDGDVKETLNAKGYGIFYDKTVTEPASGDKETMRQETRNFIDDVCRDDDDEKIKCKGWKIVDVHNLETVNGVYAITIETGENEAIIAFRGSESVNLEQVVRDWIIADGGIAKGELTDQELAAGQYLDYIAEHFDYENLSLTGHSLGGNLALVAAVYSATEMSHTDASTRIRQSVSMDGRDIQWNFLRNILMRLSRCRA